MTIDSPVLVTLPPLMEALTSGVAVDVAIEAPTLTTPPETPLASVIELFSDRAFTATSPLTVTLCPSSI